VTRDLTFGLFLVASLVSEHIIPSVHGVSEHVQLLENSLVCDLPFHGLIDDDMCMEKGSCAGDPPRRSGAVGLKVFLMKKLMDRIASSPRTAETRFSM
jgi:hypothetical protein